MRPLLRNSYSGNLGLSTNNKNMLKNNVTLPQKAATASELHPALPKISTLRLRSENGASIRGDSLFGELSINHISTKELGGGYRHTVRVNLREQGDIPPAGAQLTIINRDTVAGEDRARQAVHALLAALIFFSDETDGGDVAEIHADSQVGADGSIIKLGLVGSSEFDVSGVTGPIDATLKRVIGRES